MDALTSKIDIKKWHKKSLSFEGVSYDDLKKQIISAIKNHDFKIKKIDDSNSFISIEALYGSRLKAFLIGLIPFGKHFPTGKRLKLRASIKNEPTPSINIQITPYMEIFGSEEVGGVTQSFDEKATDEYYGAKKLYAILYDTYDSLKIPLPEEFLEFDIKGLAKDTFLGILIYPLDSYKAAKPIYLTDDPGPEWCWGGFIIPEFWFMWNEIWGVSLLAVIPTATYFQAERFGFSPFIQYALLAVMLAVRILLGFKGNKIYFAKYGRWPN
jgi:hypothetical protein